MGKFYKEVTAAFPDLDEKKPVRSTAGVSRATMMGKDQAVLMENGKPVTVGQALSEIDQAVEQIPAMLQKYYLPLKQPRCPLSVPFRAFLTAITQDSPDFCYELEVKVKTAAINDWESVVDALCIEDIEGSPSYRAVLISKDGDMSERKRVHALAIEFNREGTSTIRKLEIDRAIAKMVWENLLGSSVAVVVESGLGMDIDASGKNQVATGTGGSRAGAAEVAWQEIKSNQTLNSKAIPKKVIPQIERCSKLLVQTVGADAIASTVVSIAKTAQSLFEDDKGDSLYSQLETQLTESRKITKNCIDINKELDTNEKAWDAIKPEAEFFTPENVTSGKPAVMEMQEHMKHEVESKKTTTSASASSSSTASSSSSEKKSFFKHNK